MRRDTRREEGREEEDARGGGEADPRRGEPGEDGDGEQRDDGREAGDLIDGPIELEEIRRGMRGDTHVPNATSARTASRR